MTSWKKLTKDCEAYTRGGVLLTSDVDGFIVMGIWDADEFDEYRGEYRMAWNYGPAIIDGSNWHPTHWMPCEALPDLPKAPEQAVSL
jgi:hypothetical protein